MVANRSLTRSSLPIVALPRILSFETITAIPLSALEGHNVVEPGNGAMPWYRGPTCCSGSRQSEPQKREAQQPFSMPVQWVNRPNLDFRGFSGRIGSGSIKPGDSVRISPSGVSSRVKEIAVCGRRQSRSGRRRFRHSDFSGRS